MRGEATAGRSRSPFPAAVLPPGGRQRNDTGGTGGDSPGTAGDRPGTGRDSPGTQSRSPPGDTETPGAVLSPVLLSARGRSQPVAVPSPVPFSAWCRSPPPAALPVPARACRALPARRRSGRPGMPGPGPGPMAPNTGQLRTAGQRDRPGQ